MNNYKLTIQYDGSRYDGWQKQGNTDNTIQGKLEKVLAKLTDEKIEIIGAGRTDAGVHAKNQVANFKCNKNYKPEEILDYINEYLPEDIAVSNVEAVQMRFHARLNVTAKKYLYRINNSNVSNVFERKYTYKYTEYLDIEAMKTAADYLIGEHDFKSFCSNGRLKKSTVRTIYDIKISKINNEIQILFYGNGFLYNMIRIMVGTLLEVGCGKRNPEEMLVILEHKKREMAGYTVPPYGLTLMEIEY